MLAPSVEVVVAMRGWSEGEVVTKVSITLREQGLGGENLRGVGGRRWMVITDCIAWLSLIRLPDRNEGAILSIFTLVMAV